MVAVRVGDHGEPREVVPRAEHRARLHPVSRVPDDEPVTEEVLGRAGDLELDLHLPVTGVDGLEIGRMSHMSEMDNLETLTIVFQMAPCWLCWSCVSLIWDEVTMVLPKKSQ